MTSNASTHRFLSLEAGSCQWGKGNGQKAFGSKAMKGLFISMIPELIFVQLTFSEVTITLHSRRSFKWKDIPLSLTICTPI